jgi:transketolase
MALAERMLNARLGDEIIDHTTYVIAGDGCLMEGLSHEAISLAGHLGLGKLIVFFDDNGISIDGPTSLAVSDDQVMRFKAADWNTLSIDGHDPKAISEAIKKARSDASKPWLMAMAHQRRPERPPPTEHRWAKTKYKVRANDWDGPTPRLKFQTEL